MLRTAHSLLLSILRVEVDADGETDGALRVVEAVRQLAMDEICFDEAEIEVVIDSEVDAAADCVGETRG